jgi:LDH2 family malate/lactate/ureidoglycolate dehydrogenase
MLRSIVRSADAPKACHPKAVTMTDRTSQTYPTDHLRTFTERVFVRLGVSDEDARQAADVLAAADLRGVDSHGIVRLPAYANLLAEGRSNPRPSITVVRQTACTATVDGDNGMGLIVGPKANALAIEKAQASGSGWVAVCNSHHYGIAGYYALQAVQSGLIGWAMTNAAPQVVPAGGVQKMLGTNPIAVGFPGGNEPPVVIDVATSAAAFGKIRLALRDGKEIPDGWAIDRHGAPTRAPGDLFDGGALLPLGSALERGSHKGYCLAALVDLLCGVLSGACWGPFVPPLFAKPVAGERTVGRGIGHFFGAWRIDGFIDPVEYRRGFDDWVRTLRTTKPAAGVAEVLIPGDPERRAETQRRANGVPLPATVVTELRAVAARTGVPFD